MFSESLSTSLISAQWFSLFCLLCSLFSMHINYSSLLQPPCFCGSTIVRIHRPSLLIFIHKDTGNYWENRTIFLLPGHKLLSHCVVHQLCLHQLPLTVKLLIQKREGERGRECGNKDGGGINQNY